MFKVLGIVPVTASPMMGDLLAFGSCLLDITARTLRDPQGRTHAALRWDGDAPGGHHRKGVLRFQPLRPAPPAVTLEMRGGGEVSERTFTWPVADR